MLKKLKKGDIVYIKNNSSTGEKVYSKMSGEVVCESMFSKDSYKVRLFENFSKCISLNYPAFEEETPVISRKNLEKLNVGMTVLVIGSQTVGSIVKLYTDSAVAAIRPSKNLKEDDLMYASFEKIEPVFNDMLLKI